MPEINFWAILVSAVAAMVLGGVWYGPLFGKLWMEGMGWNPSDRAQMDKVKKAAGPAYFQQFIGSLLTAWVVAHIVWAFGEALPPMHPALAGLQAGFWSWLGFILPVKYGDKLWGGKKLKFVSVDLGYYLALLILMGLIFSYWK